MGLFSRKKRTPGPLSARDARKETESRLQEFVESREHVEAYFEAATPRSPSSMVLVAGSGEWTRRKVPDIKAAAKLCRELGIPLYDVAATGYPPAMREWNERNPGSTHR